MLIFRFLFSAQANAIHRYRLELLRQHNAEEVCKLETCFGVVQLIGRGVLILSPSLGWAVLEIPLPGTDLTHPLIELVELEASLPIMLGIIQFRPREGLFW